MEELTIREVCGHGYPPLFEQAMHLIGIHVSRRKESRLLVYSRWATVLVSFCCIFVSCRAIIHKLPLLLEEGAHDQLGLGILWLVITISGITKYFVTILCRENIIRIGEFGIRNRQEGRKIGSTVETLIKWNSMVFFYGIFFIGICWSEIPVLSWFLPMPPPGVNGTLGNVVVEWMVRFVSVLFILLSVAFTASNSMRSLAFLITQLQELKKEVISIGKDNYEEEMAKAVDRHNQIIELYQDVNTVLSPIFTFQISIATMISAVVIFSLHFNTQFNQALSFNLPLGICSTIEFGMYCKLGEEITHGFSELHRAVYKTIWYNQKQKDKTSLMIVQEMAKKKFHIIAAKVFIANLHTCVQVFQNAFSYYVIMKTMLASSEE